jgi:hypothetical protein
MLEAAAEAASGSLGIHPVADCMRALSGDVCIPPAGALALPAAGAADAGAHVTVVGLALDAPVLLRRSAGPAAAMRLGLLDLGCCMSTSLPKERGDMP